MRINFIEVYYLHIHILNFFSKGKYSKGFHKLDASSTFSCSQKQEFFSKNWVFEYSFLKANETKMIES